MPGKSWLGVFRDIEMSVCLGQEIAGQGDGGECFLVMTIFIAVLAVVLNQTMERPSLLSRDRAHLSMSITWGRVFALRLEARQAAGIPPSGPISVRGSASRGESERGEVGIRWGR